jgi:hypothetical protein
MDRVKLELEDLARARGKRRIFIERKLLPVGVTNRY